MFVGFRLGALQDPQGSRQDARTAGLRHAPAAFRPHHGRQERGQHGCQTDTRGERDGGGVRPLLLRFRASEPLGQQRGVFRSSAQKQPLVQKGTGERLAPGQASECAHRRDCRTHKPSNKREIPQTVAARGRLQRGEGVHRRVAHQQLQLGGKHHRRTLQVKVAGRDFLQARETAAAHQKLCRHVAERGGDTAVDGPDHHTDAQISPVQGIIRLESVQPRRVAASEHLHQNGSLEMAKRAVHSASRHAWQSQ